MEEERFKVLYILTSTGAMRKFTFDSFTDDKQNQRYIFHNEENDNILTLHYHDVSYRLTAPIKED
jgi:hypothetical protein